MFRGLRQLVSVILLSFILITFANTVFADAYSDCMAKYSSEEYVKQCNEYDNQYTDCKNSVSETVKGVCGTDQNCISTYTTYYLQGCEELNTKAQDCFNQNTQLLNQMCGSGGSYYCGNGTLDEGEGCDDGNRESGDGCDSSCMTEDIVPPAIPNISTLPGPDAKTVGNVSSYLMSNFLPRVARTVISFAIGAAVLGLILSSIGLLTAYGNEEKYGNAKKGMFMSLVGLVIALLAFAIVQLVFFTGFQIGNVI